MSVEKKSGEKTSGWDAFKKYFDTWENRAASVAQRTLESPAVLEPAGRALSAAMRAKAVADGLAASAWGTLGLPTKRDQERTLHALQQIQSRLFDLEDKLAERTAELAERTAELAQARADAQALAASKPTAKSTSSAESKPSAEPTPTAPDAAPQHDPG
jgi:hypothetical protein